MCTRLSIASLALVASLVGACQRDATPTVPLANEVSMKVTDKGFEPQDLRVKKGNPVKLTITRVSDASCATEIVIDEYGIKTPLPLNEAVSVTFTPKQSGQLKYGCAMDKMIGGVIRIE